MTPGELNKIKSAVAKAAADLFAREANEENTAESLAEELSEAVTEAMVSMYEEIQAKSYNLVVVSSFRLAEEVYTAAVGPLSTRATQRARGLGERFAWDYKTRTGEGKYTLVPLVRNPHEAWDEARREGLQEFEKFLDSITPGVEATYEAMRFEMPDSVRARITPTWQADPDILGRLYGPACICALRSVRLDGMPCPRHPEGNASGGQAPS